MSDKSQARELFATYLSPEERRRLNAVRLLLSTPDRVRSASEIARMLIVSGCERALAEAGAKA